MRRDAHGLNRLIALGRAQGWLSAAELAREMRHDTLSLAELAAIAQKILDQGVEIRRE